MKLALSLAIIIFSIAFIDHITGRYIFLSIMDFFDPDGYLTYFEKYSDPDRDLLRYERLYSYDNYQYYMELAFSEHKKALAKAMRKAKRRYDYITLYTIEMMLDGDEAAARRWNFWQNTTKEERQ